MLLRQILSDQKWYGGTSLPAAIITILFKQSFRLMLNYRVDRFIWTHRFPGSGFFIMWMKRTQLKNFGCYVSYEAIIDERISFPHPIGIVIGENCQVASKVTIYQNCTFGRGSDGKYPILKKGCTVYPNSTVIGGITIEKFAIIGAHSFVNRSVEEGETFYKK